MDSSCSKHRKFSSISYALLEEKLLFSVGLRGKKFLFKGSNIKYFKKLRSEKEFSHNRLDGQLVGTTVAEHHVSVYKKETLKRKTVIYFGKKIKFQLNFFL